MGGKKKKKSSNQPAQFNILYFHQVTKVLLQHDNTCISSHVNPTFTCKTLKQ